MNTNNTFKEQLEATWALTGEAFEDYVPPSWDVYFMRLSYDVATKSKDPSTKFGAVIVRDRRPILFGYNGLSQKVRDDSERLNTDAKYLWTVHAETNAIACAARYGIATDRTTLYISAWPCPTCAGIVASAGITCIVLHRPAVIIFSKDPKWNNAISRDMFDEAGIEVRFLEEFVGRSAYISKRRYNL